MYTSVVGKIFLETYNAQLKENYSAKSFFEKIFVPLFFDHPKYMMTAGNSPLENPKLSWDNMILGNKPFETAEQRKTRIENMINKIETQKADASIAVGYERDDLTSASSGQLTDIDLPENKENVYLSWVGAGLGIGVTGGITILFDEPNLLMDIFKGWIYYRQYLNNNPQLKGNQINTWNGQWIAHRYGFAFDEKYPTDGFNPMEINENGLFNIPTISWVKVLLGIAMHFPTKNLLGYLYNIGQTNITIGFIPFKINEINRPEQFYERIFGKEDFARNFKQTEELYGTAFGLKYACQYGAIGIKALEPKGLNNYMPGNRKKISLNDNDDKQKITFKTYLIWILAMINNETLWEQSQSIAKLLLNYETGARKTKTDRVNNVKKLLDSATVKQFIQNIIPIVEDEKSDGKDINDYKKLGEMINEMPRDNFPYFDVLIKFQYALLNK